MTDYGQELRFGVFVTPAATAAGRVLELAKLADVAGLDLVTFQDHPYQPRFLDTWTLRSVVAGPTSTVRLAPNVANLPLRPPAVLARSVASLDALSGGRVELGLGAGAFWDGVAAMGGRRLTPGQSVDALAEAIEIIRGLWAPGGRTLRHEGEHYRVVGAHPGPSPAHDVEIWLGAYRPRMLALTGGTADGWLPSQSYAAPAALPAMGAAIDEAAHAAGRAPADVRRLYNVNGSFGARRRLSRGRPRRLGGAARRADARDRHEHVPAGRRRRGRPAAVRGRGRSRGARAGRDRARPRRRHARDLAAGVRRAGGRAVRGRPDARRRHPPQRGAAVGGGDPARGPGAGSRASVHGRPAGCGPPPRGRPRRPARGARAAAGPDRAGGAGRGRRRRRPRVHQRDDDPPRTTGHSAPTARSSAGSSPATTRSRTAASSRTCAARTRGSPRSSTGSRRSTT